MERIPDSTILKLRPGYALASLFDYACPSPRQSDLCRYHYLSLVPRVAKVFVEQVGGSGMVNMICSLISRVASVSVFIVHEVTQPPPLFRATVFASLQSP